MPKKIKRFVDHCLLAKQCVNTHEEISHRAMMTMLNEHASHIEEIYKLIEKKNNPPEND